MQNRSYSFMLQELSNNYYHHQISFDEYRAQRRHILDSIDSHYNGVDIQQNINESAKLAAARVSEQERAIQLGETLTIAADGSFGKSTDN